MKVIFKNVAVGVAMNMAVGVAMGALATAAAAQEAYPERPVDLVITFGPGGGSDTMGRTAARLAEGGLGAAIPASNVSGASGNAGLTRVLTSPADGYTLGTLIALTVSSWASGLGIARPDQFDVVGVLQSSPSMLLVPESSPYETAEDLLAHAEENPNTLKVATSGFGTMDDITLKYLAGRGMAMTNVPFAKPAERYASTVGAHTQVIYEEPGDVAQFIQSGDLVPLVVFADARHPEFPDVPASAELGLDISGLDNFRTIAVRKGTPPEIVERLHEVFGHVTESREWQDFCAKTYTCTDNMPVEDANAMVAKFYDKVKDLLAKQS